MAELLFFVLLVSVLPLLMLSIAAAAFGIWLYKRKFMVLALLCIPFVVLPWLFLFPDVLYLNGIFQRSGALGRNQVVLVTMGWMAVLGGWPVMHFIARQLGRDNKR